MALSFRDVPRPRARALRLATRRSGGTADAADLNSAARKGVRVRISAPAPLAPGSGTAASAGTIDPGARSHRCGTRNLVRCQQSLGGRAVSCRPMNLVHLKSDRAVHGQVGGPLEGVGTVGARPSPASGGSGVGAYSATSASGSRPTGLDWRTARTVGPKAEEDRAVGLWRFYRVGAYGYALKTRPGSGATARPTTAPGRKTGGLIRVGCPGPRRGLVSAARKGVRVQISAPASRPAWAEPGSSTALGRPLGFAARGVKAGLPRCGRPRASTGECPPEYRPPVRREPGWIGRSSDPSKGGARPPLTGGFGAADHRPMAMEMAGLGPFRRGPWSDRGELRLTLQGPAKYRRSRAALPPPLLAHARLSALAPVLHHAPPPLSDGALPSTGLRSAWRGAEITWDARAVSREYSPSRGHRDAA